MSQITSYAAGAAAGTVLTLTGDAGGAISPDGAGNITLAGGTNIGTTGAGNTITVNLDGTITLTRVNATTFDTNVAAAGVTLVGTTLQADGTDADIDINITPKGTGLLITTAILADSYYTSSVTAGLTMNNNDIIADGTDADININITAKGTGQVIIDDLNLTTPLAIAYGGTNANAMATAYGVNYYDGTRIVTTTAGTVAQVLTSNGAGVAPTYQDNDPIIWSREAGAGVAAVARHGYINTNVGLTTFTLPAAAALGTVIEIIGESAAGWTIAQNAGQSIQYGNASTTVGVGGSLSSSNRYDTVRIVCRVANTTWSVTSVVGVLNVV
jgi:hypothetical protein